MSGNIPYEACGATVVDFRNQTHLCIKEPNHDDGHRSKGGVSWRQRPDQLWWSDSYEGVIETTDWGGYRDSDGSNEREGR